MKNLLLIIIILLGISTGIDAQIAINSTNTPPNPTSMLDINSPTKGLLIPRMTAFQKAAINPVPTGLMVYDLTLNQFSYFNGSVWVDVSGASGSPWTVSSPNAYYNNSGNVGIGLTNPSAKLDVLTTTANSIAVQGINSSGGYGVYGRSQSGGFGVLGEAFGANAKGGLFFTDGSAVNETALRAETISGGTAAFFTAPGTTGKALIVDAGNVGIGNTNPTKAKLIVDSAPSLQTNAVFGSNGQGISFQKNWPTIGFNSYRDNANAQKYMANGYAFVNAVNQSDGAIFWNSLGTGSADGSVGTNEKYAMGLSQSGNLEVVGKYTGKQISVGTGSTVQVYANAIGENANASGFYATAIGYNSVASGFYSATLGSSNNATQDYSTAIGKGNTASGLRSVAIGSSATASGQNSVAIGTLTTAAGTNCTAMGYKVEAFAFASGSFIIGDSDPDNQGYSYGYSDVFDARFKGGYYFRTSGNTTNVGVRVVSGGNAWTTISDSTKKHNLLPVNGEDFLQKIAKLKLTSWNYKTQDAKTFRHYGPMAQDFYNAFGKDALGTIGCDTLINQADFDGVNLIAIQALEKRTRDLLIMNQNIQAENASLKNELNALKESNKAFLRLKDEMTEIKAMLQNSGNAVEKINKQAEK
jgi:hypothetical protein